MLRGTRVRIVGAVASAEARLDNRVIRTYDYEVKAQKIAKPGGDRETAERLLDTAERLFAEHGFDGVGMRALADVAGVNLGAATYHFGTKEKLYSETFLRRFRPVGAARLELLRGAEAAANGKALSVETIVECLVRPPFLSVLEHHDFPVLLARNLFMPPPFMRTILEKEMRPSLEPFFAALAKSLPKLRPDILQMRLLFSGGALLMFAGQAGQMLRQTAGDAQLMEFALKELVHFIAAGLQSESAAPKEIKMPTPFPLQRPRV